MNRLTDWSTKLAFPEVFVGLAIVTVWALAASVGSVVLGLLGVAVLSAAYIVALRSGVHFYLWVLCLLTIIAVVISFGATIFTALGSPMVLGVLALLGATSVLALMQTVRTYQARRRGAAVDDSIVWTPLIGVGICGMVTGVTLAALVRLGQGPPRSWIWVPVATAAVFVAGFALALFPLRAATQTSEKRWTPGERIPPAPLGDEQLNTQTATPPRSRF